MGSIDGLGFTPRAQDIYNRMKAKVFPYGDEKSQEDLDELFRSVSDQNSHGRDDQVDGQEAQIVEDLLDQHDRGRMGGIQTYENPEISAALFEMRTWKECTAIKWDPLDPASKDAAREKYNEFIAKYPDSKLIPEAYYLLLSTYASSSQEADEIIRMLCEQYPASFATSRSLDRVHLKARSRGDLDRAVEYAKLWLAVPEESYEAYRPGPTYEQMKAKMLFSIAEGYRTQGDLHNAELILEEIVACDASGTITYENAEAILFYELRGDEHYKESWKEYQKRKYFDQIPLNVGGTSFGKGGREIYARARSRLYPIDDEKTLAQFDKVFARLAAVVDANGRIDRREAEIAEEILNRHADSLAGMSFYKSEGIAAALEEIQSWEQCEITWNKTNINNKTEVAAAHATIEQYIDSYPNSSLIPRAYSMLSLLYRYGLDSPAAEAIASTMVSRYSEAEETPELLLSYARFFAQKLEFGRAYEYMDQLLSLPDFEENSGWTPKVIEEIKTERLFYKAEYLREQGDIESAKGVLQEIISTGVDSSSNPWVYFAGGILRYELGTGWQEEDKNAWEGYMLYRYENAYDFATQQAKNEFNWTEARRVLINEQTNASQKGFVMKTDSFARLLSYLELVQTKRVEDALALAAELSRSGEATAFLNRIGMGAPVDEQSKISTAMRLHILLLCYCDNVDEVSLATHRTLDYVDAETKTYQDHNLLLVRSGSRGYLFDEDNILGLDNSSFEAGSLRDFQGDLEVFGQAQLVSTPFELDQSICTEGSKDKFYEQISTLDKDLTQALLPEDAKKTLEELRHQINGLEWHREKLDSLAKIYPMLPPEHLTGVTFEFNPAVASEAVCGEYYVGEQLINLECNSETTAAHEIGHHVDLRRFPDRADEVLNTVDDPRLLFYSVSWETANLTQKHAGWTIKEDASREDFASSYAMTNGKEDYADAYEAYVTGNGDLTRDYVREQMEKGNFEPAVKYLIMKYLVFYDKSDGFCFEYDLTAKDPALSLEEVRTSLSTWVDTNPGAVSADTQNVLDEVEQKYRAAQAQQ
ncbi:MAG: hypothetical protein HQ596_06455 [Candidatus Saganbacteria bacterium]|nr:hypothetical protein [Candidatus Saganbacteria bacterium]